MFIDFLFWLICNVSIGWNPASDNEPIAFLPFWLCRERPLTILPVWVFGRSKFVELKATKVNGMDNWRIKGLEKDKYPRTVAFSLVQESKWSSHQPARGRAACRCDVCGAAERGDPQKTTTARRIHGFQVERKGFCKMISRPCGKHDAPYKNSLSLSLKTIVQTRSMSPRRSQSSFSASKFATGMTFFVSFHESWNSSLLRTPEESPAQHFVAHRSAALRIDGMGIL